MAYQARVDQLFENNKAFAKDWKNPGWMTAMSANGKANKNVALILTCLDPRCVPEQFFGPELRSGVIRNAGGRPTQDTIRTLLALRSLADAQAVLVIHHTDCGLTHLTDAGIAADAKERTPSDGARREIEAIENTELGFGCFTSDQYVQVIKDDVQTLRKVEALKGMDIIGMSFDLETGIVTKVDV